MNYNDDRLTQLEEEKKQALENANNQFNDLINEREDITNQQNDLINKWEQTQNENLDEQLQFQKDLIEQQKQEAQQAYEQEAKSAYSDYRKETDAYGVSREQQAAGGLGNAQGYSESSRTSMYNTYQNRLATSKKTMDDAYLEFNNAIREAQLANDATKAENALQALQQKLQIALEGFNYKSEQTQNQMNWQYQIGNDYYNRYQDVLNQINYEKQQAEAIRQWEEEMAFQKQQAELAQQQWEKEYNLSKQAMDQSYSRESSSGGSSSSGTQLTGGSSSPTGNTSANGMKIVKNPYTGTINPDAQYGVFEYSKEPGSGYQPNNIGGKKLTKSGKTVSQMLGTTGNTGSTGINIDNQSVWKLGNNYYVWDGSQNKYVDITSSIGKSFSISYNENYTGRGGGGF